MHQSQLLSKKNFAFLVQVRLGVALSVCSGGIVSSRPTWKDFIMSFSSFTYFIWLNEQYEEPREINYFCSSFKS